MLQSNSGTYLLICPVDHSRHIRVGARGLLVFNVGYYLYVGSAFGPGGVRARVGRHRKRRKPKRWHIDYLTAYYKPEFALISYDENRLEHVWASCLEQQCNLDVIKGFGNSDCRCSSHLFFSETTPDQAALASSLAGDVNVTEF
ncbi:MAG: GIY-YIG nuclease family protein [Gammaproteobacteria bacterium]|jgi:Uri superfamily endonuclease|nr:GIY-YIG nuclease family protein [Gammaproteobacteria bacterium]MBT7369136.1 GIY-YIG nuclease family protein [Gammaproteobacteria bacterium]